VPEVVVLLHIAPQNPSHTDPVPRKNLDIEIVEGLNHVLEINIDHADLGQDRFKKEYISNPKKRSSSSSSSSSSDHILESRKIINSRVSSNNRNIANESKIRNDSPDCVIVDGKILDEINEDKFAPKQFTSSKSTKVPENILIDLKKNIIKVPEVEPIEPDSIFHH
ncbi:hypothetical protein NQ314_000720, partial [Rhamnusium bicolor]